MSNSSYLETGPTMVRGSDSQSTIHHKLVLHTCESFEDEDGHLNQGEGQRTIQFIGYETKIYWVSGHQDISGSQFAHEAAQVS